MNLEQPRSKSLWLAGLFAAAFGPLGMQYSTPVGALVMLPIYIVAIMFGGYFWGVVVTLICIIWAVLAARD